jgi:nucleotide-binding universal stress UspA family protein
MHQARSADAFTAWINARVPVRGLMACTDSAMPADQRRKELAMYSSILVATDGSRLSAKAVTHAIALAKAVGAKLIAFNVIPDNFPRPMYTEGLAYPPMSPKEYAALSKKAADGILGPVLKKAKAAGVEASAESVMASAPWKAILAAARKHKCDAIVMASHGRHGVAALFLGSETQKVLGHSTLPVIVVR